MKYFRHRPIEDVHNPFALVHLLAFLKRHGWWMVLVIALTVFLFYSNIQQDQSEVSQALERLKGQFGNPKDFSDLYLMGEPHPALDAEGNYWVLRTETSLKPEQIEQEQTEHFVEPVDAEVEWSDEEGDFEDLPSMMELMDQFAYPPDLFKQKQDYESADSLVVLDSDDQPVVVIPAGGRRYHTPLCSKARGEFIFVSDFANIYDRLIEVETLLTENCNRFSAILLVDSHTGTVAEAFAVQGYLKPCDISPDGEWLAALYSKVLMTDYPPYFDNEVVRGMDDTVHLVNLINRKVVELPYRAAGCAFEKNGDLLLLRTNALLRLTAPDWKFESIVRKPRDRHKYLGDNNWITPWNGGRYHFFEAQLDQDTTGRYRQMYTKSVSLSGNTRIQERFVSVPIDHLQDPWIKPNIRGLLNGEGFTVEMGNPQPYTMDEYGIAYHPNEAAESIAWKITDSDGAVLAEVNADRLIPPYFINSDTLLVPRPPNEETAVEYSQPPQRSSQMNIPLTNLVWEKIPLSSIAEGNDQ